MKKLHVATSPLTGTIYAGTLLKTSKWGVDKTDVTVPALVAVAEHTLKNNGAVIISTADGTPVYEITVKRLPEGEVNG
ncbi:MULTISPECIES: DUF7446 family protein [Aeromonas]|uniref:DUF7446 family protein n=1 Tax=Aeromonas TaxID=642 RepID=UPI000390C32D|nr:MULTISPECIES: hypothetical protein [Aeromonas]MBL0523183.1 hypothetical protein [Aeromonas enteropelogenes]QMS78787.1 hypothetical protein M001_021975 [Aeromonas veronii Hm21]